MANSSVQENLFPSADESKENARNQVLLNNEVGNKAEINGKDLDVKPSKDHSMSQSELPEESDHRNYDVEAVCRFCPRLQTLDGRFLGFLHGVEAATVGRICPCLQAHDGRVLWFLRGMKFHREYIAPNNNGSYFDEQYGLKLLAELKNLNLRDESEDGKENYDNIEEDEQYQRIKLDLGKLMDEGDDH